MKRQGMKPGVSDICLPYASGKYNKALEAYCTNYAKWQKCEQIIDEKGYSMEVGDNGYEQQRPEVSIANKAQTEMRAWAKELGLTPAARQRMKAESAQGDGGIDAELDGMIAHD